MSDFDNQVVAFKDSMVKSGLYVNGDENTDVQTAAGPVPSLAKQAKAARLTIEALVPDIGNRLSTSEFVDYTEQGRVIGRANLGMDQVNNTSDENKPISTAVAAAVQELVLSIATKEDPLNRNKPNGYPSLDGMRLKLYNNANNMLSLLQNDVTAPRAWTLPDASGVLALKSDITGTNTGTNTGDETTARVKALLGITTLSGANTGDETTATILTKLSIPSIAGTNTGDETNETIIEKIGYDVMPLGARGAVDGVAPLGPDRLIPTEYLHPAFESLGFFDDVGTLPSTGVEKRLYVTQANSGMYYWNGITYVDLKAVLNNTDMLAEGDTNLYFSYERVLNTMLDGFTVGDPNVVVAMTDDIITALSKLQSQASGIRTLANQKEASANKAIDFSVVDDVKFPTTKAVKGYLDVRLASVVNDQGSWDASSTAWPTAGSLEDGGVKKGDFWYVNTAGTLGGVDVNVGDSFRALQDNPGTTAANWDVLESNLGYVPYNATNPLGFTANQTDAYLLSRANHAGTQSADTVTDSGTRVMVTPAQKTAITHANRAALDQVSGTNTGDETLLTIQTKLGSTSNLTEGTNLYYQDARVIAAPLTGYAAAATNVAITVTDSVLAAFGKAQKQIDDLKAANGGTSTGDNTGDETKASIESKLAGNLTVASATPNVVFDENDQNGTLGKWRQIADGAVWRLDTNTAVARDFSSFISALSISSLGLVTMPGLNVVPVTSSATGGSAVVITAQSSNGTGAGGGINLTAGNAATAAANQVGGSITLTAGNGAPGTGAPPSGRGGNVTITAGKGASGSGGAQAGGVTIRGGQGGDTSGSGGPVALQGGSSTNGSGGGVNILGADGPLGGGAVLVRAGAPTSAGSGGQLSLVTPDIATNSGDGGAVVITAGSVAQTNNVTGNGGSVNITAGSSVGTTGGNGGDVAIAAGNSTAGVKGKVAITAPGGVTVDTTLTMAGNINMTGTSRGITYNSAAGLRRWVQSVDNTTETGSGNVGSDYRIGRYDDAGVQIDTPLAISRATGAVIISTNMAVQGISAAGQLSISNSAPIITLTETDQVGTGGVWRIAADGNTLRMDMNTSANRDNSTYVTPFQIGATGVVQMSQGVNINTVANAAGSGTHLFLRAGAGSTGGGLTQLSAGAGTGTDASGGSVSIQAGAANGAGTGGSVVIAAGTSPTGTKGAVTVTAPGGMTVDTTLSVAGSLVELVANKAVDFSVINNTLYPSVQAVSSYVDSRLVGILNDRGTYDASVNTYPTTGGSGTAGAIRKGDFWYVGVAGTLGGAAVGIGDSFRALVDAPGQTAANWAQLESNIGYVPENAANKNGTGGYAGLNGFNIILKNAAGTVSSQFASAATAGCVWTMPDKSGTVAMLSDITALTGTYGINTTGSVKFNDAANANTTYYLSFGDGVAAQTTLKADAALTYNPSTDTLGVNSIQAAAVLSLKAGGTSVAQIFTNGLAQFEVSGPANSVSRVRARGGVAGVGPVLEAISSETDAHLVLQGQGAGQVISNSVVNFQAGTMSSELDKGTVSSGTVTFSAKSADVQKLTVGGPLTIATTGWPGAGSYASILIELVNGGAFAVTMSGISWILPTTGAPAASFAAYLTAIGRTPASLQASGTDWIVLWSTNGGATVYGKLA